MDPALYDASLRGRKLPFTSTPLKYRFYTIITISIQNAVHILKVYNEYNDSLFEVTNTSVQYGGYLPGNKNHGVGDGFKKKKYLGPHL